MKNQKKMNEKLFNLKPLFMRTNEIIEKKQYELNTLRNTQLKNELSRELAEKKNNEPKCI